MSFTYHVEDEVGTITFRRPEKLNAVTFDAYRKLTTLFAKLERDPARAIIVTGQGRGFCTGGDVNEIIAALVDMKPAGRLAFTKMTCDLIRNIRKLSKPVAAAVNGLCAGAGAAIATACDVRFAAESARFAFLFPRVGLSGADMGVSFLLPRIVGFGRAAELMLAGDFFDAAEAHRIGFVNRVFPADALLNETRTFAKRLAEGPRQALARTKEMMNREISANLDEALDGEAKVQARLMGTPDFREAYRAFVEKRPPRFER
jgi:enoyl-CoA hydratase/carnithine racemase